MDLRVHTSTASKSNALTKHGNVLLSPPEAGFLVRTFALSWRVSRNELAVIETLSCSAPSEIEILF
jgi:hypothetical protein